MDKKDCGVLPNCYAVILVTATCCLGVHRRGLVDEGAVHRVQAVRTTKPNSRSSSFASMMRMRPWQSCFAEGLPLSPSSLGPYGTRATRQSGKGASGTLPILGIEGITRSSRSMRSRRLVGGLRAVDLLSVIARLIMLLVTMAVSSNWFWRMRSMQRERRRGSVSRPSPGRLDATGHWLEW